MSKKNIAIVFGGKSVEHEVSVITGLQVLENIDKTKFEPIPLYILKNGEWICGDELWDFENYKKRNFKNCSKVYFMHNQNDNSLYFNSQKSIVNARKKMSIDAAFCALHGTYGEDGCIQGLFELSNVPYTGSGVVASATGMDKVLMKMLFTQQKLPIVPYLWFYRNSFESNKNDILKKVELLGYPVFIKPANLGSSVGISKAHTVDECLKAIEVASFYDRKIIVEKSIEHGREINCSVMGYDDILKVSLCEEPIGWKDILSYQDKYMKSGSKTKGNNRIIPANIPDSMRQNIEQYAKQSFTAIDAKGIARVDFLLQNDTVFVNEINTIPGSMAFYMWEPMGISFQELITELIDIAFITNSEKNKNIYSYDVDLFEKAMYKSSVK